MHSSLPRFGSGPTPPLGGLRSLSVFLSLLFSVLALLSVGVRPACAATYQVTTLADDGSAGTLRAAITAANAANTSAGSTITFAPGLSGTITLGSGLPALAANMTIVGPGASVIAVDGAGAYRPFSVNSGVTAALSGLTIQNGKVVHDSGGGVLNNGVLTLTGCTLTGNSANGLRVSPYGYDDVGYGGGVSNFGTLTLTGCTLTGNSSNGSEGASGVGGGYGGGVYNYASSTATLTGCTLTQNSASLSGGGVYNEGNGALTLTGCTLTGNSTNNGGYGGGVFNNAFATLTACTLTRNSATYGGGMENFGTATLTGCTLTQNSASFDGGGMENDGAATLTGCTLAGNSTNNGGYGGGVFNAATATLTACTLIQNSATSGGGVFNNNNATLMACTLTGNSATHGGGVANLGTLTLTDDILYGDTAPNGSEFNYAGNSSVTASHCDIQQSGFAGSGNLSTNPLFVTPFVSGASPYDLHLKAGSPCFHVGAALPPGTTDRDGIPYAAPKPSLGAYEYGFYVTNTNDSGAGSLRAVITYANGNTGTTITSTILFAPGLSGTITLGSGLPALAANMTIVGPGASVVAVDGAGAYRPFSINSGVTAALSGLTIQNGNSAQHGGGVENFGTLTLTGCTLAGNSASFGGGVFNAAKATATLTGCTLVGNSAADGGGVFNDTGTATLTACTLIGNSANNGGGVRNFGTLTLTDDILYGDSAPNGSEVAGTVTATYCDIQGGFAGSGNLSADPLFVTPFVSGASPYDLHLKAGSPCFHVGAALPPGTTDCDGNLYAAPKPSLGAYEYGFEVTNRLDDSEAGTLRAAITMANAANASAGSTITFAPGLSGTIMLGSGLPALAANMTIVGPGASVIAVDGAGAYRPFSVNSGVTAALSGLTVQNGSATYGGGVENFGTLTLTGCTLTGNSANSGGIGGGVYNNGTATLTACTLIQNSATSGGGGGVANDGNGALTLTGCTLTGNSTNNGGYGGGVFNAATATLTACTLTGNSANTGGGVSNQGSSTLTLTDDILYGDTAPNGSEVAGTVTATYCDIQGGYMGTGNLNADPLLAPLGNYGGPTQTFALLPGSPCLGAGTNAGLFADQRGVAVPQAGRYDIGAFESQGFTVTATGGSGQSATVGTAFALSLTATVTANSNPEPVAGGLLAFTGPLSGASATFSPAPATIGGNGSASVTATATANGVPGGPYSVAADTGAGRASYTLTNTKAAPIVALTSSLNPSTFGQSVTFTATLSGGITPTGTVTFTVDGAAGSPVALSGATSTYAASGLAPGDHTVTAAYSGDGSNATGTSSALTQTVTRATTATALTSSLNPSVSGQAVTFRATLSGGVSPGGTVTFKDGGLPFGSGTIGGGKAVFTTSALAAGPHMVTATYSGDGSNASSTSGTLTQTVNPVAVDVTGSVTVTQGGFTRLPRTTTLVQKVTLTNTGTTTITGPLSLALDALTGGVTLANMTGATTSISGGGVGSPYLSVAGDLAPGASVSVSLRFSDPRLALILYTPRVLAGPGGR